MKGMIALGMYIGIIVGALLLDRYVPEVSISNQALVGFALLGAFLWSMFTLHLSAKAGEKNKALDDVRTWIGILSAFGLLIWAALRAGA